MSLFSQQGFLWKSPFLVGPLIAPLGGGQVMMIFSPLDTCLVATFLGQRRIKAIIYLRAISWALETRGWEITLCFLSR